MTIGTQEHAILSSDAYKDRSNDMAEDKIVNLNGVKYKIIAVADRPSGYQGVAYRREDTGEVIIAHRGTQPPTEDLKDVLTDLGMVKGFNNQLGDAMDFTAKAMEEAKKWAERTGKPLSITITGHSLGGCLAQITAARYGLPAETFNAYGAAYQQNLQAYGVKPGDYPNIINHARATDPATAASPHLGPVRTYASREDVESLQKGRYIGHADKAPNPLLAMDVSAHSISNFLPDRPGGSIATQNNAVRAFVHNEAIKHFREDLALDRADLFVINRPPILRTPEQREKAERIQSHLAEAAQVGGAKLAHAGLNLVGTAIYEDALAKQRMVQETGQALVQGMQTAGRGVRHGAEATAQVVQSAGRAMRDDAKEAGQTIERGAYVASQAVRHGVEATVQVAQSAGRAMRDDAREAGQTIGRGAQAVSQGIEQRLDMMRQEMAEMQRKFESKFDLLSQQIQQRGPAPVAPQHAAPALSPETTTQRPPAAAQGLGLDDPGHPGHAMFKQAREGVQKMAAQHNKTLSEEQVDNLAGGLAAAARRDGLTRVDHVVLGTDAKYVFAFQGDIKSSLRRESDVQTMEALSTPMTKSTQAWEQGDAQQVAQAQQWALQRQQQEQQQGQGMSR